MECGRGAHMDQNDPHSVLTIQPSAEDSPIASRFTIGISFFSNLPEFNQFKNPQRPEDPYVFKFTERWSLISIAVSGAFKITEWLSIGGGVIPRIDSFQDTTGSWILVDRALFDPNDPSGGFRLDLRQTTKINVSPLAGILFKPPIDGLRDKVSIGLSYRAKIWGF